MSADQHMKPLGSAPGSDSSPANPKKVRSTRYDWAHDLPPAESTEPGKQDKIATRSSLWQRALAWLRDLFRAGRSPFDRDDDPDPMAA